MVPRKTSPFGRPPDFPLPALFVLLGLKFDSALSPCTILDSTGMNWFWLRVSTRHFFGLVISG